MTDKNGADISLPASAHAAPGLHMVAGIHFDRFRVLVSEVAAAALVAHTAATIERLKWEAPTGPADGFKAKVARAAQANQHSTHAAAIAILLDRDDDRLGVLQRIVAKGIYRRSVPDTDLLCATQLLAIYGAKGHPCIATACPECCALTAAVPEKDAEGDRAVPGGWRGWRATGRECADCGWTNAIRKYL